MIDHIDHIVLTTRDLAGCIRFYSEVLGMQLERFRTPTEERLALKFGPQKINIHVKGREFEPKAHLPTPGSLDLCFLAAVPLEDVMARLAQAGDLLYFHQQGAASPDHLMVMVGASRFDRERRDWVVYHTGPDGESAGEVRKVSLADLEQHPAPRWRPIAANPAFVGVFRLTILDTEGAASP